MSALSSLSIYVVADGIANVMSTEIELMCSKSAGRVSAWRLLTLIPFCTWLNLKAVV